MSKQIAVLLRAPQPDAPEPTKASDSARAEKVADDFKFMVLCAAKNNMPMYHLLRDRSLDDQETKK